MFVRLVAWWDAVRSSFWFLPACLALAAVACAVAFPILDEAVADEVFERWTWFQITPEAGRATLAAIAGAMITATTLVFSMTLVTLSITTSQFGSRLLRTFMADVVPQATIGILLATSLYCLLVLRRVGDAEEGLVTPNISVYVGLMGAVVSLGALIYFIHHIAMLIQAPHVATLIAEDINGSIDRLFPEELGEPGDGARPPHADPGEAAPDVQLAALAAPPGAIRAHHEGYVQAVDEDALLELACRGDFVLRLARRPGDFVTQGMTLAEVWPAAQAEEAAPDTREAFLLGGRRTSRQDLLCSIEDLVEVAVRALSPGINAPFTAVASIDRLAGSLARLARRRIPSPYRVDEEGRLRVIAPPVDFPTALDAAYRPIQFYGRHDATIQLRLMTALAIIAGAASRPDDWEALSRFVDRIRRSCDASIGDSEDRKEIHARCRETLELIERQRNSSG